MTECKHTSYVRLLWFRRERFFFEVLRGEGEGNGGHQEEPLEREHLCKLYASQ